MNSFLNYKGDLSRLSKQDLQDLLTYLENYRLRYRSEIDIPLEESFGVEIEFGEISLGKVENNLRPNPNYRYWNIHEDSSVEEYKSGQWLGGEVSSDILHDTKEEWETLYAILKDLRSLGAKATDQTGFHIHIGAQIFEENLEYVKRFIKVWCIFEDIIFRFGYGRINKHRPYIKEHASPIASSYYKLYMKNHNFLDDFTTTKMFDFGKKRAVSFKNYHYLSYEEETNNTIEIRCPNGTLEANIAQNNINFFIKLMLYVKSNRYNEKLIDRLFIRLEPKGLGDYSFMDIDKALMLSDLIFEETLDKINFLKQYIKKDDFETIRQFIL